MTSIKDYLHRTPLFFPGVLSDKQPTDSLVGIMNAPVIGKKRSITLKKKKNIFDQFGP